jgi:hypothetical protein
MAAAVLTAAALAVGIPPGEAEAKRKRSTISARLGGKRFKAAGRRVTSSYGNLIFLVGGGAQKGKTARALAVTCVPIDLAAVTLPYECPGGGGGNYQETTIKRPPVVRASGTLHGLRVIIDFYDGVRVRGTFSGTFDIESVSGAPPRGPIAVEDGKFDVVLPRQ